MTDAGPANKPGCAFSRPSPQHAPGSGSGRLSRAKRGRWPSKQFGAARGGAPYWRGRSAPRCSLPTKPTGATGRLALATASEAELDPGGDAAAGTLAVCCGGGRTVEMRIAGAALDMHAESNRRGRRGAPGRGLASRGEDRCAIRARPASGSPSFCNPPARIRCQRGPPDTAASKLRRRDQIRCVASGWKRLGRGGREPGQKKADRQTVPSHHAARLPPHERSHPAEPSFL